MENCSRSAGDIAIDENRDALVARGKNSPRHGGDLAPA
jgi:hypothetical protein